MANLSGLETLLRLKPKTFASSIPDMGAFEPSEGALRQAQLTPGVGTISTGGRTGKTRGVITGRGSAVTGEFEEPGISHTFSRQDIRDESMAELARELGLGDIEHQRKLDVAGLQSDAALRNLLALESGRNYRSEMLEAGRGERASEAAELRRELTEKGILSREGIAGAGQQTQRDIASQREAGLTSRAEAKKPTGWGDLFKMLGWGNEAPPAVEQMPATVGDEAIVESTEWAPGRDPRVRIRVR